MHTTFWPLALVCAFSTLAHAQTPSNPTLPTAEQFQSSLTTCAAGSNLTINGEIRGSFTTVFEGLRTDAKNFTVDVQGKFLDSLRPEDKLEGFKIYSACVISILSGEKTSEKKIPEFIQIPASIETSGEPLEIVAKTLAADGATIRSFPAGSRGENGTPGQNGRNGGNGQSGAGGAGGHGRPGDAGGEGGAGADAGPITLKAETFVGSLKIINSGVPGGIGGDGGGGGRGGAGGKGTASINGVFDCRSGPGVGGAGGDAADGGDGGKGGSGGNGGTVVIEFASVAPGSSIAVVSQGGAGGQGGAAGPAGARGRGGELGSTGGKCGSGGRGPGADGASASAGRSLGEGPSGIPGQIEITIGNQTSVVTGEYSRSF